MSEQRGNRPPIRPNPFSVMSTWMFADPVAGATRRPNLRIRVVGNVPRISVRTNVPDDRNNGVIDFNTDLATFAVILRAIRDIADGKVESRKFNYIDDFVAGKKLDKPVVVSTVHIGKDRESGRVFMSVLGYNRPKIRFFFGPSKYHAMVNGDGSEISEAEVSAAYAHGFVDSYLPLVLQLLVTEFNPEAKNVAKPPSAQGGGGQRGGGGYQNRGGSSGGGGADFSDVENFDEWT